MDTMFNSTVCDSQDYFTFKSDYVSCIKVNGRPILPPLMTPERYLEMQKYRQLAIEIENNLKKKKKAPIETVESTVVNENIENNYAENAGYIENLSEYDNECIQFVEPQSPPVNDTTEKSLFEHSNNISNAGSPKVLTSSSFIIEEKPRFDETTIHQNSKSLSSKQSPIDSVHCGAGDNSSVENLDPPRLIRTNSYILDAPSPMLLSFLENQRANVNSAPPKSANLDLIKKHPINNESRRRSCWDLASAKEKWTSFENNINFSFIPSKINIKNVKSKLSRTKSASLPASSSPSPTSQLDGKIVEPKGNVRRNSLTNDSKSCKKTLFCNKFNSLDVKRASERKSCIPTYSPENVQVKNRSNESSNLEIQGKEFELLNSTENCDLLHTTLNSSGIIDDKLLVIESKIKEVYQSLQNEHATKMNELMIRQKQEQEMLIMHFKQQQMLFIEQIRNNYLDISNGPCSNNSTNSPNTPLPAVDNYLTVPESSSESEDMSSQTIHFQPDNNSTITSPDYCLNVGSILSESSYTDTADDVNTIVRSMLNKSRNEPGTIYIQNNIPVRFHINTYTNISNFEAYDFRCKELFANVRRNSNTFEIAAIIKIQAGIRGFLVRRLLKTERVQSLIQTLKDTLICALEFHSENNDNIQPADVELHKRLIQQLTAACFAIHDTFFKLTTKEKMGIISSDRQRIKDKMLRPPSARNSPILSATTQKIIQRKLQRSNLPSPANDESQSTQRKFGEFNKTGSVSSGTSNPSLISLTRTNINNNVRPKKGVSNNKNLNKKPWR